MKTVALGGLLGLAWAASLRGWMVDLAGDDSSFTWTGTFVCLLLPSGVVGSLLGRAVDLRRTGTAPRWLKFSPLLLPLPPLAMPGAVGHLLRTGEGSASMIMVSLAMLGGASLAGGQRIWIRLFYGAFGFAPVPLMLSSARTPHEAWAATLIAALYLLLALACALPLGVHQPVGAGIYQRDDAEPRALTTSTDHPAPEFQSAKPEVETVMPKSDSPPMLLPGQHAAPEGPVDLQNMYVMHHAFRRDLHRFQAVVPAIEAHEKNRWQQVHERWQFFATTLHHHHSAEDAGLWPLMLSRASAADDMAAVEVLEAMEAEHASIDPVLNDCADAFSRLASGGTEKDRQELSSSLEAAWRLLDRHLGHEERDAMTILQRYLTDEEWRGVEREHFRPAYSPREIWHAIPWSQVGLPDDVGRRVRASGGPVVVLLWWLSRRSYARREQAVFGTTDL